MYAEIKYDGERVQVHKQGDRFEYFSRSLKAVQPHKVGVVGVWLWICVWEGHGGCTVYAWMLLLSTVYVIG